MPTGTAKTPVRESAKFYAREAAADPYIYQGSVLLPAGDVEYEKWARCFGLEGQDVMTQVGNYAYTFRLARAA